MKVNPNITDVYFFPLSPVLMPLQRCLEQTIDYTRERQAFGRSILDNQVVHFRLAELETELELLRSLLHRTISERGSREEEGREGGGERERGKK